MEFDGFDWDEGNRNKCCKHGLSLAEIERLFTRPVLLLPDLENSQDERRFRAIGTTASGRKVSWRSQPRQRHSADQRAIHASARGGKL